VNSVEVAYSRRHNFVCSRRHSSRASGCYAPTCLFTFLSSEIILSLVPKHGIRSPSHCNRLWSAPKSSTDSGGRKGNRREASPNWHPRSISRPSVWVQRIAFSRTGSRHRARNAPQPNESRSNACNHYLQPANFVEIGESGPDLYPNGADPKKKSLAIAGHPAVCQERASALAR
jgi:hypothetical protein